MARKGLSYLHAYVLSAQRNGRQDADLLLLG